MPEEPDPEEFTPPDKVWDDFEEYPLGEISSGWSGGNWEYWAPLSLNVGEIEIYGKLKYPIPNT